MAISSNLAQYSNGGPVGILQGQSMFASDSTRQGIYDARNSFINILNVIFARNPIAIDRPDAVATLDVTTPINAQLIWRQASGSQTIEPVPPNTEWDYMVYTMEERDALLLDPAFKALLANPVRVLVNGLGNPDAPQWSVWEITGTSSPASAYTLANSYDYSVDSFNDRNALLVASTPISIGQRVLVTGNTSTNGFWTIWEYVGVNPANSNIDVNGFKLNRYQTYRTSDFWSYVDWYATGYAANSPPVVTYATQAARDAAENPNPTTTFVKVLDDGNGNWLWTAYASGEWTIVARQNGTIAFSNSLYTNPALPTIGLDPILSSDIAKFATRDGSWELQILFNLLQDSALLEDSEVNEVFFSMLHFVHAQQDQVPWAFKTSFMTIGGYNESLTQTPVEPVDNTENLTNYITEVKPYRVVIRDFAQILTPPIDNCVVHATDFDFPLYYDSTTGKYRFLSLTNPSDLNIIETQSPWKDWFATYNTPGQTSLVRSFNITMHFDRVDHMPVIEQQTITYANNTVLSLSLDPSIDIRTEIVEVFYNDDVQPNAAYSVSDAMEVTLLAPPPLTTPVTVRVRQNLTAGLEASRIQQFYDPANAQAAEANLRQLMGLNFKRDILDGGSLANNAATDYTFDATVSGAESDEYINPNGSYYGLADPSIDANRPEELVLTGSGESLRVVIRDVSNGAMAFANYRPGTDLMAPSQTGDFDAAPLDDLVFDVGYATETQVVGSGVYAGQVKNLMVIREDAWEYMNWTQGGIILADMGPTDQSVTVSITANSEMPFTIPVVEDMMIADTGDFTAEQVTTQITKPGVVWIDGERIEFFAYNINANGTVTLSQLRRGTHNTRIGSEQLLSASYPGDGTNSTFLLPGGTAQGLNVQTNDVARNTDGTVLMSDGYTGYKITVPKVQGVDYTVIDNEDGITAVFTVPPVATATVTLYETTSSSIHPASSKVYNGYSTFFPGDSAAPPPVAGVVTFMTACSIVDAITANASSGAVFPTESFQPTIGDYDIEGIYCWDSALSGPDMEGEVIFTFTLEGDVPPGLSIVDPPNTLSYNPGSSQDDPLNNAGAAFNGTHYANENYPGYLNNTNGYYFLYNGQYANFSTDPLTVPGTYNFTLVATSRSGSVGRLPISLTINQPYEQMRFVGYADQTLTSYDYSSDPNTPAYLILSCIDSLYTEDTTDQVISFEIIGSLPDGISLGPDTYSPNYSGGVGGIGQSFECSGSATTSGTYNFIVKATNVHTGLTATLPVTWVVSGTQSSGGDSSGGTTPPANAVAFESYQTGVWQNPNQTTSFLISTENSTYLLVAAGVEATTGAAPVIGSVTSPGLTFSKVIEHTGGSDTTLSIWMAPLTSSLNNQQVTISVSGSYDDASFFAAGLTNCQGLDATTLPMAVDVAADGANPTFNNVQMGGAGMLAYISTTDYADSGGSLPPKFGFSQLEQVTTVTNSADIRWSSLLVCQQYVDSSGTGGAGNYQTIQSGITDEGSVAVLIAFAQNGSTAPTQSTSGGSTGNSTSTSNSVSNGSTTSNTTTSGSHSYWQMSMPGVSGGIGIGEIAFLDFAGNILSTSGIPFGTGTYSPGSCFDPAQAYDNNDDTFWCGVSDPSALGYHFTTPVQVAQVTITNRSTNSGSYGAQFPTSYSLQYSDDGVNYTTLYSGTIPSTPASGSFTTTPPGHAYWGIRCNTGYGNPFALSELQFNYANGSIISTTTGQPNADSIYSSNYAAAYAFDGNEATEWASADTTAGTKLWYNFTSPITVDSVTLIARNDSYYGQAPDAFDVIYSDDGENWTTAWSDNFPTPSQGRIYTSVSASVQRSTVYGGHTAQGAWALRLIGDTYSGPLVRVQRASDGAEMDIGAVNGYLDTATLQSFTSGTTANLVTLYDQTGNLNHFIVTQGSCPIVTSYGVVSFADRNGFQLQNSAYLTSSLLFHNEPFTAFVTNINNGSGYQCLLAGINNNSGMGLGLSGNTYDLQQNGVSNTPAGAAAAENTANLMTCSSATGLVNGSATVSFFLNGATAGTVTQAYNGSPVGGTTLAADGGMDTFTGAMSEVAIFGLLSASDQTAIENNIKAAYGL